MGKTVVRGTPREHNVPNLRGLAPRVVWEIGSATLAPAVFGGVGSVSMRRTATVQAFLLLVAMCANASVTNNIRITVLDSETRASTPDNNGVPQNCDQLTFDAYCRSTTIVPLVSTLLVREGSRPPFRISCTITSRYSGAQRCPRARVSTPKEKSTALWCTTWMTRVRSESSYTRS